jgi:hypothetical protein
MSIPTTGGEFAFAVQYTKYGDGSPENKKARALITLTNNTLAAHTVTVGAITYAFMAVPAAPNDVLIGATVAQSAKNLADAINGTANGGVFAGSNPSVVAWADNAAGIVYLTAWSPARAVGNGLTLSKVGANIEVSAFAGGITGGVAQKAFGVVTAIANPIAATTELVLGTQTYEFVSGAPGAYGANTVQVRVGADISESMARLAKAINNTGVAGTEYSAGTPANADARVSSYTDYALHIEAVTPGVAGNSLVFTEAGAEFVISGAGTLADGTDASVFDQSRITWNRVRSAEVDYAENQMQDIFPPQIGGSLVPDGAYKTGVSVRGGATLMPRLERSMGDLLLAALGKVDTTNPTAGVYVHAFKFNTNEVDIPWVAARRMLPGRDEVFGDGLIGWDNKVALLRTTVAAAAPVQMVMQLQGRRPEKDNHPEVWVGQTFEDFKSIPLACKGSFLLPTIPGLPRNLTIVQAIVEMANVVSTEREEMVVGDYFPEDVVPLRRIMTIRTVYKWRDAALAQYLFGSQLRATTWSPQPFQTVTAAGEYAFDLAVEAPYNITGTDTPYSLRIRGNSVVWQPGAIRMRAGELIMMELTGTVMWNTGSYVEFVLTNGQSAYAVPLEG